MRKAIAFLLISSVTAAAEEAEWNALYDCLDHHRAGVADVVASVDEGAALIVEVLCLNESIDVANAMVNARIGRSMEAEAFKVAFETYMQVIVREMREQIYLEKLGRR